ncbi:S-adenosylmethionine:tRNA ribosyltransferase-isomerase [Porphyromonas sp.]
MNIRPQEIQIADYDYPLPDERIAKYPLADRSSSKLLRYQAGEIEEFTFRDLPRLLPEGAVLVRNNSKVIRARLLFHKDSGARIEIFCLDPAIPTSYELSLGERHRCSWHCLIGNAKRFKEGTQLTRLLHREGQGEVMLTAERGEEGVIHFSWDNDAYTFGELLELMGILPIPPYLGRETEEQDLTTYQTVYAETEGSVAAPTAGLHFTPAVFEELRAQGTPVLDVTLHVGAGTFRPVKADHIGDHEMHAELISVSRSTLLSLREHIGQIIAVGTTSVRTLESLYHLAITLRRQPDTPPTALHVEQWLPYEEGTDEELTTEEALDTLLSYLDAQGEDTLVFPTSIIIAPSYRYRVIRGMVTNFHQPHSTLLLLIAALISDDWHRVYDWALTHDFRFLSYGDSSLLLP